MFSWYRPFHLFPVENRCFTTRELQKKQQFSFFKELVKTCLRTATYESLIKLSYRFRRNALRISPAVRLPNRFIANHPGSPQ
jgi:hypothetical protein